jgi:NAD(P)-dependent dehydrogenase (short-subunit alcohol dehydrogenase family)
MNLQGKTLVITGVASGIGAEVARLARYQGASVIGIDRNPPNLTLDQFYQVDLGDPQSIDQRVAELPDQLHALCNIAGVPGTAAADLVGRVNYLGLRHLSQSLLPKLSGGCIVNVASILGIEWPQRLEQHQSLASTPGFTEGSEWLAANPVAQDTCYQYFKEALIVWSTQQSPLWFRDHNVRMNCVAPGPVFTPILGDFVSMLGEERVAADAHRMKRPAYADEIADVISFLCTEQARWICGATIPVDGGLAATYL